MACRVGMTTDPEGRKADWEDHYRRIWGWKILGEYDTKSKAQTAETQFAEKLGCTAHPGGSGSEYATWYVYFFNYEK